MAEEIVTTPDLVVAAGGGAFTVWLRCELDQILARIQLDGSRPLAPDRETIIQLYTERQPSYRLADWVVDTTTGGPDDVARAVVEAFKGRKG